MSLDVGLIMKGQCSEKRTAIFIRLNGQTTEITREQWDEMNPDEEPITMEVGGDDEVFSANITHNLRNMARAAGLYEALWHPEVLNIEKAANLKEYLIVGLAKLKSDPEHFMQYNPTNGWGTYEGLVKFVSDYLVACEKYPEATVRTWV